MCVREAEVPFPCSHYLCPNTIWCNKDLLQSSQSSPSLCMRTWEDDTTAEYCLLHIASLCYLNQVSLKVQNQQYLKCYIKIVILSMIFVFLYSLPWAAPGKVYISKSRISLLIHSLFPPPLTVDQYLLWNLILKVQVREGVYLIIEDLYFKRFNIIFHSPGGSKDYLSFWVNISFHNQLKLGNKKLEQMGLIIGNPPTEKQNLFFFCRQKSVMIIDTDQYQLARKRLLFLKQNLVIFCLILEQFASLASINYICKVLRARTETRNWINHFHHLLILSQHIPQIFATKIWLKEEEYFCLQRILILIYEFAGICRHLVWDAIFRLSFMFWCVETTNSLNYCVSKLLDQRVFCIIHLMTCIYFHWR